MDKVLLNEAFKALDNLLLEDDFSLSTKKDIEELKDFRENDIADETVEIIDPEAETEEEIQDVYMGKVILDCSVCHTLIYKDIKDVEIDEDADVDDALVNVGDECPYCMSNDGYKIVGQVAAFKPTPEVKVEVEPKEDGEEAEVTVDVDGDGEADVKIEVEPSDETKEVEVTEEPKEESEEAPTEAEESKDEPKEDDAETEEVKEDEEKSESEEDKEEVEDSLAEEVCDKCGKDVEEPCEECNENLTEAKETLWDKLVKKYPELADDTTVEEGLLNKETPKHVYFAEEVVTEEVCSDCGKDLDKEEPCEDCKDKIEEGLENVNLETDKEKINISVEEKPEVEGEEMIAPLTAETEKEIEAANDIIPEPEIEVAQEEEKVEEPTSEPVEEPKEETPAEENSTEESEDEMVDIDLNDFDEESFDELGEAYLKNIYENVESFKTSDVAQKDSSLIIEGVIKFNSGKEKKTSFVFEAKDATKTGKVRFIGENLQITKGHKAFQMTGKVTEGKLIAESLNYNYRQKLEEGKSTRVYGTVRNKK